MPTYMKYYLEDTCTFNYTHLSWEQIYRVSLKKGNIAIFVLFWFEKSDFTFSHVFWNQNFRPFHIATQILSTQNLNCSKMQKDACAECGHDF